MAALESIRQQAISDANGIRWKLIADGDDFAMSGEEWLVKIAEAFEESGTGQSVVDGIMKWLLGAKKDHNWSTTKSTGDAVSLLSRNSLFSGQSVNSVALNARSFNLSVSDDPLNGNLSAFRNVYGTAFPEKITVAATTPAETRGVVNYYYFTKQPPVSENGTLLTKKLLCYNEHLKQWEELKERERLIPGEKIKVLISVETKRRLKYVYIDDKRAAAFEPADALSGYEYGNGIYYYRSVADEGFRFFLNEVPSGKSVISYEMVVAKEGIFSNGITSLECMYQPEVKAYSSNFLVNVKSGQ